MQIIELQKILNYVIYEYQYMFGFKAKHFWLYSDGVDFKIMYKNDTICLWDKDEIKTFKDFEKKYLTSNE